MRDKIFKIINYTGKILLLSVVSVIIISIGQIFHAANGLDCKSAGKDDVRYVKVDIILAHVPIIGNKYKNRYVWCANPGSEKFAKEHAAE